MSIRVMTRVWETSSHSATELLMLLALADFSDDEGNSYPAVSTLAAKCRMKTRNANYILKALVKSGELELRLNGGPKGTNRYRIINKPLQSLAGVQGGAGVQPGAGEGLQGHAATPATQGHLPLQPIADEPAVNRKEEGRRARSTAELLPDVDVQLLADWEALRKTKTKTPVSESVVKLLRREADVAGISVESAIEACIKFDWKNFDAGWFAERARKDIPTDIYAGAV